MSFPALNHLLFTLLEATITLYATDADGAPITDAPLWDGLSAEGLRVREAMITVETRPTGRPYPRKHPLVAQYEIALDRVWTIPLATLEDVALAHRHYVLDVTWTEEETGHWQRRTFYGVTFAERDVGSNGVLESGDAQRFEAEYYRSDSGAPGESIPVILPATLPYSVYWLGADGNFLLYTYDSSTHAFAEAPGGLAAARATVLHVPDQTGRWNVQFTGVAGLALSVRADGITEMGRPVVGPPTSADVPRLEFFHGPQRVLSVGHDKTVWLAALRGGTVPAGGAGRFEIHTNGTLQASFGAAGWDAEDVEVIG